MRYAVLGLLAVLTGACYTPAIYIRSRGPQASPLADRQRFRITTSPEPAGCQRLGHVAFVTKPRSLHEAIAKLRRRVLRMGGNRVAMLRCQPAKQVHPSVMFDVPRTVPIKPGQRIHCAGVVYRYPALNR